MNDNEWTWWSWDGSVIYPSDRYGYPVNGWEYYYCVFPANAH